MFQVCGILGTTTEEDSDHIVKLPCNLATIGKKHALDLSYIDCLQHDKLPISRESSDQSCDTDCLDINTSDKTNLDFLPDPVLNTVPLDILLNGSKPTSSSCKPLGEGKKNNNIDKKDILKLLDDKNEKLITRSSSSVKESHRKAFRAGSGKTASSNLRIRICNKSPPQKSGNDEKNEKRPLETDSSNEYESETGIPKSPTLFISGVSISRTPEPKSPALTGRQSRSSSLTVPLPPPPTSPLLPSSLSSSIAHLQSSSNSLSALSLSLRRRSHEPIHRNNDANHSSNTSPNLQRHNDNLKSKSASEPEREREMFRFPKSSTDGALSSVLHVQESNLSSDDFHEALFLLERSPKGNQGSKRRKKSKKERQKDKENSTAAGIVVPEASSAL